jgi:hypothetical protein
MDVVSNPDVVSDADGKDKTLPINPEKFTNVVEIRVLFIIKEK